jgi:hypothetical protein
MTCLSASSIPLSQSVTLLERRRGYDTGNDVGTVSIGADKRNKTIAGYSIAETIVNIICSTARKPQL